MSAEVKKDSFNDYEFDEPVEPLRIPAGDGLILQKLRVDDAGPMLEAIAYDRTHLLQFDDDTAAKYLTEKDIVYSILYPNDATRLRLGIWDSDSFMGSINLQPREEGVAEIGYWLGAEYIGKGVTAKAVRALTKYAFDNGYEHLYADVYAAYEDFEKPGNDASKRTLLKAGYKFTKLFNKIDEHGHVHWYWRFEQSKPEQNT